MQTEHAVNSWRAGRSASQIVIELRAKFGVERSRNGVIGKLDRLGLIGDRTKDSRRRKLFSHDLAARILSRALGKPLPLPPDEPIPATAVTLDGRLSDQCVWPVNHGEPEFLYCGAGKAPGDRRFCEHHKSRAHPQLKGRSHAR